MYKIRYNKDITVAHNKDITVVHIQGQIYGLVWGLNIPISRLRITGISGVVLYQDVMGTGTELALTTSLLSYQSQGSGERDVLMLNSGLIFNKKSR